MDIIYHTTNLGREDIPYGGIYETSIHFTHNPSSVYDLSERVGVNAKGDLRVGVYTDLETRNEFLKFAKDAPGCGNPDSIFYFDEDGNYGKIQMMNAEFNSGKRILDSYKTFQFIESEMTPEDFELAGRALGLIKQKLMTALGRTPPQNPDQNSNAPRDSG